MIPPLKWRAIIALSLMGLGCIPTENHLVHRQIYGPLLLGEKTLENIGLIMGPYLVYIWSYGKAGEAMKLSHQIKPISYLKAHAAEVARNLVKKGEPLVITQNGEAKLVVQDIESYEQTVETMALLKILALGNRQIEQGKTQKAADVIKRLRRNRDAG